MNKGLISLGSNMACGEQNMFDVMSIIEKKATTAVFSKIYETEPEGEHRHAKYKNCVGLIYSQNSYEEWYKLFKDIEIDKGRNKENRLKGNVPIDIDIIIWNEEVKKPNDLNMEYIKEGLLELNHRD